MNSNLKWNKLNPFVLVTFWSRAWFFIQVFKVINEFANFLVEKLLLDQLTRALNESDENFLKKEKMIYTVC